MLFYNPFRAIIPAKHRPLRDNRPIQHLVQIIHSHTIDSLQNPTETLPQFIDNYLSLVNIDKRRNASKSLREIVEQTSTDKNELALLDCLESFRQTVENFIRAYSSGNTTIASEEYEKFVSHFWLLRYQLRLYFFLPNWKYLHPVTLNLFELFGGVYLILDILFLDYYLNIENAENVSINCARDVLLIVRKYTLNFSFDAYYSRWYLSSPNVLGIQQLFSVNHRLITIFLAMLNPNCDNFFTNLHVNRSIIWFFTYLYIEKPKGGADFPRLFCMTMRQCNAIRVLKNFCSTTQDENLIEQSLYIMGELTKDNNQEFFRNSNSSISFLFDSLAIPSDLRPENNRIRTLFRRFCERVLTRRVFCAARNAYHTTTSEILRYASFFIGILFLRSASFELNSDSGWRSWIGKMIISGTNYLLYEDSERKVYGGLFLLENITFWAHWYPAVLERLRQEDICAKLVDILSTERSNLMTMSCRSMLYLTNKTFETAEPERRRLRELGAVEKLQYLVKYSGEGEFINKDAKDVLINLAVEADKKNEQ